MGGSERFQRTHRDPLVSTRRRPVGVDAAGAAPPGAGPCRLRGSARFARGQSGHRAASLVRSRSGVGRGGARSRTGRRAALAPCPEQLSIVGTRVVSLRFLLSGGVWVAMLRNDGPSARTGSRTAAGPVRRPRRLDLGQCIFTVSPGDPATDMNFHRATSCLFIRAPHGRGRTRLPAPAPTAQARARSTPYTGALARERGRGRTVHRADLTG